MQRVVTSVHELHGSHYRSKDPLTNLRIRTTLKRASKAAYLTSGSPSTATGAETETAGSSARPADNPARGVGSAEESDDYTFSWQEKLFSRREEEKYGDRSRCVSVKEVNYNNLLNERREKLNGRRPTDRLFTYIDQDSFADSEEFQRPYTNASDEEPTFLSDRLMMVRQNHLQGHEERFRPSRDSCGRVQPVATWKTDGRLAVAHTSSTRSQHMYIMADLTPNHLEPTQLDEYVLCSLKIDTNGVLTVLPDFNSTAGSVLLPSTPVTYRLESRHQEIFEFSIQHASVATDRETEQKEGDMVKEVYRRRTDMMSATIGDDFDSVPSADSARVLLMGEIVSAQRFNASSLFVQYLVTLPDGWYVKDEDTLSGSTQLSSASFWDWSGILTFAFPLEIEFIYCNAECPEDQIGPWPVIYFEISSIDSWKRQHVEGYTSVIVPATPGMHSFELLSWRPVLTNTRSMMQELFIGGTPQLEDITYLTVPNSSKDCSRLSRHGFQTETTGQLNVRISCVHQSCTIQERHKQLRVNRLAAQTRSSVATTSTSMFSVIDAFQQAKRRMQSARRGLS